jgi:hypothetical protein
MESKPSRAERQARVDRMRAAARGFVALHSDPEYIAAIAEVGFAADRLLALPEGATLFQSFPLAEELEAAIGKVNAAMRKHGPVKQPEDVLPPKKG